MSKFEDQDFRPKPLDSELDGLEIAKITERIKRDEALRDFDTKLAEAVRNSKALRNNPNNPDLIRALKKTRNWIWKHKQWLDYPEFVDDLFRKIGVESESASLLKGIMTPKTEQTSDDTASPAESPVSPESPEPAKPTFTLSNAKGAEGLSKLELRTPGLELDTLGPLESPKEPEILKPEDSQLPTPLELMDRGSIYPEWVISETSESQPRPVEREVLTAERVAELDAGDLLVQSDPGDPLDKPLRAEDLWRFYRIVSEGLLLARPVMNKDRVVKSLDKFLEVSLNPRKAREWRGMTIEDIANTFLNSSTYEQELALNDTRPFPINTLIAGDLFTLSEEEKDYTKTLDFGSADGDFRKNLRATLEESAREHIRRYRNNDNLTPSDIATINEAMALFDRHLEKIAHFLDPEWKGKLAQSVEKQRLLRSKEKSRVDQLILKSVKQLWSELFTKPSVTPDIQIGESFDHNIFKDELEEARENESHIVDDWLETVDKWGKSIVKSAGSNLRQLSVDLRGRISEANAKHREKVTQEKNYNKVFNLALEQLSPALIADIKLELDDIYATLYKPMGWDKFPKRLQKLYTYKLEQAYDWDLKRAVAEAYLAHVKAKQTDADYAVTTSTSREVVDSQNTRLSGEHPITIARREIADLRSRLEQGEGGLKSERESISRLESEIQSLINHPDYKKDREVEKIKLAISAESLQKPAELAEQLDYLARENRVTYQEISQLMRDIDGASSWLVSDTRRDILGNARHLLDRATIQAFEHRIGQDPNFANGHIDRTNNEFDRAVFNKVLLGVFKEWWSNKVRGTSTVGSQIRDKQLDLRMTKGRLRQEERGVQDLSNRIALKEAEIDPRLFVDSELPQENRVSKADLMTWNNHLYNLRKRLSGKREDSIAQIRTIRKSDQDLADRLRSMLPDDLEDMKKVWKADTRRYGKLLKRVEQYEKELAQVEANMVADPEEQALDLKQSLEKLADIDSEREEWIAEVAKPWVEELVKVFQLAGIDDAITRRYANDLLSENPASADQILSAHADDLTRAGEGLGDGALADLTSRAAMAMGALNTIGTFRHGVSQLERPTSQSLTQEWENLGGKRRDRWILISKLSRIATAGLAWGMLVTLSGSGVGGRGEQTASPTSSSTRPQITSRAGVETRNDRVSGFEVTAPISNSAFATESAGLSADSSGFELAGSQSIEDPNFEPVVIQGTPEMYEQRIDRLEAQLSSAEKTRVAQIEKLYKLYLSETEKVDDLAGADKAEEFLNQIQAQLSQLDLTGQRVASYHTTGTGMSLPVFLTEQRARLETFRSILRIYNEGAA